MYYVHGLEDSTCSKDVRFSPDWSVKAIYIKIPSRFFVDTDKLIILNFIWKVTGLGVAKTFLKKNKVGGIILSDFRTYYIARVI